MSTTLSGQISSISKFLHQNTGAFGVTYSGNPLRDYERYFATSEVTKLFFASFTVTTTPTTIDLTSLTDEYGDSFSFATIKHLEIVNNDTAINLTVGGGTNGVFAALPPLSGQSPANATGSNGSCLNLTTNITVDSTHKILQLVAGSGSISVDVFIVGS